MNANDLGSGEENPGMRQKRFGIWSEQVTSLLDPQFFLSLSQYYSTTGLLDYHYLLFKVTVRFGKIKLLLTGTRILGMSFYSILLHYLFVKRKGWIRENKAFLELGEKNQDNK